MIRVRESFDVIDGFGCRYRRVTREWLLLGLRVWTQVSTVRI